MANTSKTVAFWDSEVGYFETVVSTMSEQEALAAVRLNRKNAKLVTPKPSNDVEYDGVQWVKKKTPSGYFATALDDLHNKVAVARGYESRHTIATYANSLVPEWKKEAEDFLAWRDQTTLRLIEVINSNDRPSVEDFIAGLPEAPWQTNK